MFSRHAFSGPGDGLHRAGWVVKDPATVIPNGYVLVRSGVIQEVGPYPPPPSATVGMAACDHGPGALMPALVNTHTHLELSCFHNKISYKNGFQPWVQALVAYRERTSPAEMAAGAERGLAEMHSSGTGALCEISSLGITAPLVGQPDRKRGSSWR